MDYFIPLQEAVINKPAFLISVIDYGLYLSDESTKTAECFTTTAKYRISANTMETGKYFDR
jgi:hypothetical protein